MERASGSVLLLSTAAGARWGPISARGCLVLVHIGVVSRGSRSVPKPVGFVKERQSLPVLLLIVEAGL
jgi:hypothetical protein